MPQFIAECVSKVTGEVFTYEITADTFHPEFGRTSAVGWAMCWHDAGHLDYRVTHMINPTNGEVFYCLLFRPILGH